MIDRGTASAKQSHETVAQILVYHAAMFLDRLNRHPKETVEQLHYLPGFHRGRLRSRRSDIDKHHRDFLLHATQPWITFQNLLGGALAHMKAKGLAKPFLFLQ